jgi:RHS repeat-associated protein
VQDSETGLSYFGARYYDPVVGRFMGVDAVGFNPGNLQSFNRYAYANNNPYRFVDPDGNSGQEVLDWLGSRPAWFVGIPGRVYDRWNDPSQRLPNGPENAANAALAIAGGMAAGNALKGEIAVEAPAINITAPYARPNGATTAEQRASVQGKPCVDCAATTPRQVADHKEPLVKEYYRTGTIDKEKMKSVDAVQPQCPTCSAKQGAEMSKFSKEKKDEYGFK